jgi:hypothetical protein
MKLRITITTRNGDGFVEIWLNEAGRDLLVKELQGLNEKWDHFHLDREEYAMDVPVQTVPYRVGDIVHAWGKVLLRTDAGDAQHFPHVLQVKAP